MKRRTFLKLASLGAAGAVVGLPRVARADPWGDLPGSELPFTPVQKVLEIYLFGGCAPWESFYYRPDPGGRTRGFDTEVTNLAWNPSCSGTPSGLETQLLANDAKGKPIHLGPFAKPLFRSDIRSRMRVVVLSHDLLPHEAAIPYALAGKRLGRPNFNGLGAPIQRRARVLAGGAHPLPYSYCLVPPFAITSPLFSALQAVGAHGGNARPLALPISTSAGTFLGELDRSAYAASNDLIDQYRAQYRQRLVPPGGSDPTRAAAFWDYDSSVSSLFSAPQLTSLLSSAPLSPMPAFGCSAPPPAPATFPGGYNFGATALQAAAYLLTRTGDQEARYACVVHAGMNGTSVYDVHDNSGGPNQAAVTSMNLWDVLNGLAGVIRDPGNPSPSDAQKLDLNNTLIVIKTEFGRTPYKSLGGNPVSTANGRDHWPDGYVHILIGGPIASPGVAGSIADGGGSGDQGKAEVGFSYRPEDINSAVLLAAGIDPFADGNFQVGELTPSLQGPDHPSTRHNLRQTILGVTA